MRARSSAWTERQTSNLMVAGSKTSLRIPPGPKKVFVMAEDKTIDETITQVRQQIEVLLNDNSVPRNVKSALDEARKSLDQKGESYSVRASGATYKIDEVSNDINLPPYARTVIWNMLSLLEEIKE